METDVEMSQLAAIAREAGAAIMAIYESGAWEVTRKEDCSPLTEADLAAHRVIEAGLLALTPDIPILSEEAAEIPYEVRKGWRRYWLVDPLDGTKEFIKKNGQFTVNIALMENNRPVAGVVTAPALGVSYYAAKGSGAYRQTGDGPHEKINVAPYREGPLVIVASRSHRREEENRFLEDFGREVAITAIGSSLKFCKVAEGSAHLYPRLGPTMEWDIAAAQIIVEEAGGSVTDPLGGPIRYNKENLLNPHFIVSAPLPFALPKIPAKG